jgi:hypothetical protein
MMDVNDQDKKVQDMRGLLHKLLTALGVEDVTTTVERQDNNIVTIEVDGWGIGIDVGVDIALKPIAGGHIVPGYGVWYTIISPANRRHPEEVELFTEVETLSRTDALQALGELVVRQRLSEILLAKSTEGR